MSRSLAISNTTEQFDNGAFFNLLERSVALPTESQATDSQPELYRYLNDFITPHVKAMGFSVNIYDNPVAERGPFMIATRIEHPELPTVLSYGHGDVVRGYEAQWREGLSPWQVTVEGDRWYGRGTADNKGQHLINLTALEQTLKARDGKLGFNVKLLLEMGEEEGSPGLNAFCAAHSEELAADVFIASDGPRLAASRPTIFSAHAGCSTSSWWSICAKAPITLATGAACWPTLASFWPMPSPA